MNDPLRTIPALSGLAPGWLLGTWEVACSTAGIALPDPAYHHFDADGRYILELAFDKGGRVPWIESIYRAQHDGFWTSFDPSRQPQVSSWFTRFVPCEPFFDEIVITGYSGDRWWLRRMERPSGFLRFFVDSATGRLIRHGEMPKPSRSVVIQA